MDWTGLLCLFESPGIGLSSWLKAGKRRVFLVYLVICIIGRRQGMMTWQDRALPQKEAKN